MKAVTFTEEVVPVYNLEVEGDHVYRVGHSGLLVYPALCLRYHGTESTSTPKVIANGLNKADFIAPNPVHHRGFS